MFAFRRRQVALLTKPSFQFVRLCLGEQNSPLLLLGRRDDRRRSPANDRRVCFERIQQAARAGGVGQFCRGIEPEVRA